MSATDFIPRRQADVRNWSINFNAKINADPESFGLTFAQAADYNTLHNAFTAAYALANSPSTNSKSNTRSKDTALHALKQKARQLAAIIRAHPGITSAQKSVLSLTIRGRGGRQRAFPQPMHAPYVTIRPGPGAMVELRLRDATSTKSGQPDGVHSATIFCWVGDNPPGTIPEWRWVDATTKTKYIVNLPADAQPGDKVWYIACWQNPRGELGPAARPVCTFRQFGPGIVGMRRAA